MRLSLAHLFLFLMVAGSLAAAVQSVDASTSEQERLKPEAVQSHKRSSYSYGFELFDAQNLIGLLVLAAMMVLCTLGGIGGNVVILPVCLILFRFDPHVSIAHTTLYSTVSCLTRVLYELRATGRDKKSNINYDVTLLCCTPSILGSFCGVFLNQMSPDAVILLITVCLLTGLLYSSFKKYRETAAKEASSRLAQQLLDSPAEDNTAGMVELKQLGGSSGEPEQRPPAAGLSDGKPHSQFEFCRSDIPYVIFLLTINPVICLVRGNKVTPSMFAIEKCSSVDLMVVATFVVVLLGVSIDIRERISRRNRHAVSSADNVDFRGPKQNHAMYIVFVVGLVGSFLSVGSSALLTFSLIMLGITPFSASPTALLIGIIFGSSVSVVFFLEGLIYIGSAVFGSIVVCLGTFVTRATVYEGFVKQGKGSMILLFISVMMALCIVLSVAQVLPKILTQYEEGKNVWALRSLC